MILFRIEVHIDPNYIKEVSANFQDDRLKIVAARVYANGKKIVSRKTRRKKELPKYKIQGNNEFI